MNASMHDAMAAAAERRVIERKVAEQSAFQARLDALLKQMEADRPALQELHEILPILIAGLVQVKARMDIHDEIMRLCQTDAPG